MPRPCREAPWGVQVCVCTHAHVSARAGTRTRFPLGNFPPFPWAGWEAAEQARRSIPALCCWPWDEGMPAAEGMDQGHSLPSPAAVDRVVRVAFWGAARVSQLHIPLQRSSGLEMSWTPSTRMPQGGTVSAPGGTCSEQGPHRGRGRTGMASNSDVPLTASPLPLPSPRSR